MGPLRHLETQVLSADELLQIEDEWVEQQSSTVAAQQEDDSDNEGGVSLAGYEDTPMGDPRHRLEEEESEEEED